MRHHPLTLTRRVTAGSMGLHPRWPFATDIPRSHPSPPLSPPPLHRTRPRGWRDGQKHTSVSYAASGGRIPFRAAARPVATAPLMSYAVGDTMVAATGIGRTGATSPPKSGCAPRRCEESEPGVGRVLPNQSIL